MGTVARILQQSVVRAVTACDVTGYKESQACMARTPMFHATATREMDTMANGWGRARTEWLAAQEPPSPNSGT